MPKLTLMLDRQLVNVYEVDQPRIRIGRSPEMDIRVDNVSVSRWQAELERTTSGWLVRDIGSSNGTFVNGDRLINDRDLRPGDEISFGKFSLFFERVPIGTPRERPARPVPMGDAEATLFLRPEEMQQLQEAAALKRRAHLVWEAAGQRGVHYLDTESIPLLIGTAAECGLRVPAGPKRHLVLSRGPRGFEILGLSFWRRMRVQGRRVRRVALAGGTVVEIAGLKLTFMAEVR
jgi:hypothetical protein